MRHVNVFCGSYDLKTGTRVIAWFYIVIYLFNIFINIFALDIVEAYRDDMNEDLKYNETNILAFHYICLTFGILTIILSAAVLVKLSDESEYFLKFIVTWNVFRCFFTFTGIIYVCAAMDDILTVAISCVILVIDLCASTYFTGIMASFVKELEDPHGQDMSTEKHSEIQLISHKKSVHQHQVTIVNETADDTSLTEPGPSNATVSPSSREDSKVETKGLQMETVEVDKELNYVTVSSEDPEPTTQEAQQSPSNDTGPVDTDKKSETPKEQNEEAMNTDPKNDEVSNITHCDPELELESPKSDEVQDPDVGMTNLAVQVNDMDDQTGKVL